MNPTGGSHDVRPEFRAHLEWQIESALRRETRFATTAAGGRMPRLRAALVVVAALATGGIAVAASGELQDARQRDLLIATANSEEALVRLRVELARADYDDTRRRFETGTAGRETLQAAERQLHEMEAALARIRLDIEEIRLTSAAPRNDLQAPLVGERDFVRERLTLELETAQRGLVAAEKALEQAKQRVEVGIAPRAAQLQAEAELEQARARLQQLSATLDLRQRALNGEIKAEELATALRRIELRLRNDRLQREMQIARGRVEEVRRLVEIGQGTQLELKRAEVELLERELELQRIRQELEMVGGVRR
jgi:outer membrane protein TolC